jgi:serine/threonine protein kinase
MDYDLVEMKARGAFATVWRAKERVTGRVLAVKKFESSDMRRTKIAVRNESQILDVSRSGVSISTSH